MPSVRRLMGGSLGAAVAEKMSGEQPGKVRAFAGAAVAGSAAAVVVYRLLRSGGSGDEDE